MIKGKADYLALGDYNAICDVCGAKYKASQLLTRWDGMKVCKQDYEGKHPLLSIHPIQEQSTPPWTRPNTGYATDAVTELTSNTVLTTQTIVPIDASAGNVTITLPAASYYTIPYASGITFQRVDSSTTYTVTIQRAGTDTILGGTSITMPPSTITRLVSDSVSNWIRP